MKKTLIILSVVLLGTALTASAQKQQPKKQSFEKKLSKFLKETKRGMEQAGHEIGDAIGFDDRIGKQADLLKVDGSYYMPLYDKDLYRGDSALAFRTECTKLFRKKYPQVNIRSVAIPQEKWLTETVEKDGEIVGYQQTLYCYVIGRDGDDGYINAKFAYSRYKDIGQPYQRLKGMWPQWERTDILTNDIYAQLLKL